MADIFDHEHCVVGKALGENCANAPTVRFLVEDKYGAISLGACDTHRDLVRSRIERHRSDTSTLTERAV